MQSLTETLGNGVTITNAYTVDGYFSSQKHMLSSTAILHNTYNFNSIKGTLNSRQNVALGTSESFTYDNLDRLTQWTNPLNGSTDSNSYDNKGRITSNNRLGTVTYNANLSTGIYRKSSILLTPEGKNYYTTLPKQVVSYTMFKSPISINESDKGSTTFTYNSHLSRQTMNYGFTITPPATTGVYTKTKDYTDDGTVEIIKTPTTITIRTYIGGDAYSAPLYVEKIKTIATGSVVDKKYYLHRDYLGSIIAISNENGVAVERRHFDAWGNLAKLQQNGVTIALPTDGTSAGLMMMDRGYTSHEHLAEVGLIHMNGRLYDPILRSFLMPDNFIQQPDNTQNYNRYAYVLNNPLMYTDPSGELGVLASLALASLGVAFSYTMTALLADVPFSVSGLLKTVFIAAAVSACTYGIGAAGGSLFTTASAGFWQGAYQGAIIGAITGAGGEVANAIFSGQDITLKAVLGGMATGAIIGGVVGGIQGGLRAQEGDANFWTGNKTVDTSNGVGMHGDPIAMQKAGFGKGEVKVKYVGTFEDVKIYESKIGLGTGESSGGVTLPPDKIIVGKGAFALLGKGNPNAIDLFHHEFGHILQSRQWFVGTTNFYKIIGFESSIVAKFGSYEFANNYWTETWANHLSDNYFGGSFFKLSKYPSAPLSNYNLSKFLSLKSFDFLNR